MQIKFQAQIYSVTGLLVLSNVVLFVMMVIVDGNQSVLNEFPVNKLIDWGANYGPLTFYGDPWRLLTYSFLQANLWHLLVNMFTLIFIGPYLERYLGRARFLLTYLFAAVMGGLMSLTVLPTTTSVGASGAIFGLCGAAILADRNVFLDSGSGEGDTKTVPPMVQLAVMVMFLISNVIIASVTPGIDIGAHVGGLLGGIIAAALFSNVARLKEKGRLLETFGIAAGLVICFADYTVLTGHFNENPHLAGHREYFMGSQLAIQKRYRESLPYFDRALQKIEPDFKPVVLIDRAKANQEMGQEIVALQDIVKAENLADPAKGYPDPDKGSVILLTVLERKGIILTTLGEYGEAEQVFKEALGKMGDKRTKFFAFITRIDPDQNKAVIFNNLAWCQAAIEKLDEAKENIDQSLSLDDNSNASLDTRGVILILLKKPAEAIADLSQAIALNPKDAASYFHRSIAYRMLGKTKEADADVATAASIGYKPDKWERGKFADDIDTLEAKRASGRDAGAGAAAGSH